MMDRILSGVRRPQTPVLVYSPPGALPIELVGRSRCIEGPGLLGMMNRNLSGVRRPKDLRSGVQPAWSTPDRIGWTKPLHRGAGPTGNWNHRPRAPRHAGGANPLQADC